MDTRRPKQFAIRFFNRIILFFIFLIIGLCLFYFVGSNQGFLDSTLLQLLNLISIISIFSLLIAIMTSFYIFFILFYFKSKSVLLTLIITIFSIILSVGIFIISRILLSVSSNFMNSTLTML